ncbi:transposase [Runella sp. S5]|uniref:Transposase n=1 Tax=Runella salmonicolor TaxID=2950278 RepID=A0ABT1FSS6_9BACT|nr:transposase [Runella salmonicolor]
MKLTKIQASTIDQWISTCRFVYNLAKETKITAYQKGVNLTRFDLINQLPALKEFEWIKAVPSESLIRAVTQLDNSFRCFYRGGGFPKWAKKDEYKSIIFVFNTKKTSDDGFYLPKIGKVKVFKDRMPNGTLKTAVIKKEDNGYFISVDFESQTEDIHPVSESQAIGLDMGLTYFLTDSNGCYVENPRHTKKYEAKLRIKRRALSRKKKGGNGYAKAKIELNRLHRKITNTRKDFLHKTSIKYVQKNSLVVVEDLKVKNMIKFGNLSKHIYDAGWSRFLYMLEYKCKNYGKTFVRVKPHFTSQMCNACGHIAKENRVTQSIFKCVNCGHGQNADYNAAQNILGEGIALVRQREGLPCA